MRAAGARAAAVGGGGSERSPALGPEHEEANDWHVTWIDTSVSFERIKKMPGWQMRWFSYKARSDPRFYLRYFGTYGLSSMLTRDWGGIGGSALANTGSGFQPGVLRDEPKALNGGVVIRKMLRMNVVADHFLLDGMDVLRAMQDLRPLLETTQLIEPSNATSP